MQGISCQQSFAASGFRIKTWHKNFNNKIIISVNIFRTLKNYLTLLSNNKNTNFSCTLLRIHAVLNRMRPNFYLNFLYPHTRHICTIEFEAFYIYWFFEYHLLKYTLLHFTHLNKFHILTPISLPYLKPVTIMWISKHNLSGQQLWTN